MSLNLVINEQTCPFEEAPIRAAFRMKIVKSSQWKGHVVDGTVVGSVAQSFCEFGEVEAVNVRKSRSDEKLMTIAAKSDGFHGALNCRRFTENQRNLWMN